MLTVLFACALKHPSPESLQAPSEITGEEYYQKAMEYAQDNSYWSKPFEAFHFFKKAAELGHIAAQDRTGWGYQFGLGTERDLYRAAYWYRSAAKAGNAQAQASLGLFLYYGIGGEKDLAEALKWSLKAAEQNHPAGLNNMGGIYDQGKAVTQDYSLAVRYYQKAAELNYVLAKSNLGSMYERGLGVKKNIDKAYALFRESCTDNNRWGFVGCYQVLKNSQSIGLDEKDHAKARDILEAACREEQGMACQFTGFIYLYGWGSRQDSSRAADFFERGCGELKSAPSCGKLGELYYYGDGVVEDMALGEILLAEACKNHDEESCRKLSDIQRGSFSRKEPGNGVKKK